MYPSRERENLEIGWRDTPYSIRIKCFSLCLSWLILICSADGGNAIIKQVKQQLKRILSRRQKRHIFDTSRIAAAVLDEAIGRNINLGRKEQVWGVTLEFTIKFKKPIPLEVELKAVTRLSNENQRIFEGTGEIFLPDGTIAATAKGRYLKMPVEKISEDFTMEPDDWIVIKTEKDPEAIEL